MQTKNLYRYTDGNKTIDSLTKPDSEYTLRYRLIADEGNTLTDGTTNTSVIDIETSDIEKWTEVPEESPEFLEDTENTEKSEAS
jgi:hypothetical protein